MSSRALKAFELRDGGQEIEMLTEFDFPREV